LYYTLAVQVIKVKARFTSSVILVMNLFLVRLWVIVMNTIFNFGFVIVAGNFLV